MTIIYLLQHPKNAEAGMVGQIISSGTEKAFSAATVSDRREISDFNNGGDFLSILKGSTEFRETRTADREENTAKPYYEDRLAEQDNNNRKTGSFESAVNSRQEYDTAKAGEAGSIGSGLKSPAGHTDKTETKKKTSEQREDAKDKQDKTGPVLAAAGEALIRKNTGIKNNPGNALAAGEKLTVKHGKEPVKTASDIIKSSDTIQAGIKGEQGLLKNDGAFQSGIKDIAKARGRGAVQNHLVKKGLEQESTAADETSRKAAAFAGGGIKEKIKSRNTADYHKHKPVEGAPLEKKGSELPEGLQLKEKLTGDDSGSRKGAGYGSDSSRDHSQLAGGRTDSVLRQGPERAGSLSRMPEFRQSLQEIIDKARITVKDSRNGSFTVRLFPRDLGNVNISLVLENGVVNGRFLVDNNDAKTMLLANMENLMEELQQSGVSVGEFSVNVRDNGERFIREKDENKYKTVPLSGGNKEAVTAAEVYDYNSVYNHNGSINMVI